MKDSDLFKTLSSTYDGAISQIQLKWVHSFWKKAPSQMFGRVIWG